jgi:hypothetical protein
MHIWILLICRSSVKMGGLAQSVWAYHHFESRELGIAGIAAGAEV